MHQNKSVDNQAEPWNFNQFQLEQNINYNDGQMNTVFDLSKDAQGNRNQKTTYTTSSISQPAPKDEQNSSKQQRTSLKRSVFHNFQKHLVITLRKAIKIKKGGKKMQPSNIAERIWEIFLQKSTIYTKNILHVLFGVVDYEGSNLNNVYDQQIIQKFGYSQIFTTYSEENILSAQAYLRQEVIRQLKQTKLDTLLQKRRIANLNEFKEYISEFIDELEQGPMRKRLPKSKKQTMRLN